MEFLSVEKRDGMATTEAAYHPAQKYKVEAILTKAVYEILSSGRDPEEVLRELMFRDLRDEDACLQLLPVI